MSTLQAEDVLRHTFRQLEKMLKDVRRPEPASPRPHRPLQERSTVGKTVTDRPENREK